MGRFHPTAPFDTHARTTRARATAAQSLPLTFCKRLPHPQAYVDDKFSQAVEVRHTTRLYATFLEIPSTTQLIIASKPSPVRRGDWHAPSTSRMPTPLSSLDIRFGFYSFPSPRAPAPPSSPPSPP